MTSLLAPRKRFFSQESYNNSSPDLPLLSVSESSRDSQQYCDSPPQYCDSPPNSGNNDINTAWSMDYNSRIIPGRASSMSLVRLRSGQSLSPQTKSKPRKTVSMYDEARQTCLPLCSNPNNPPPYLRTRHSANLNPNMVCAFLFIIGVLALSVLATTTFQHNTTLTHELQFKEQEIEMHLEHAHALERRVQGLRSETIRMHNRIEELEHPAPTPEELNIQRKVFHLEHSQEQLHRGIQEQAKRLLVEKFGPGPKYYIEMKLSFDPESNIVQDATTEIEDILWLETASVDEMPHTVHFFLEQISNGVYDNTQFYRNAPRFVQAGPGYSSEIAQQLEQDRPSLAHVLFQENSPSLIHQQYTLGYPGRPGGPDFYLNLQDNHDQHGVGAPHPHAHNDLMGSADPCFARLIRGFSTLERIHRSNVLEEAEAARRPQHRMAYPVTIEYMRVHTEDNNTEQR